ncbi:ComC/BlpC family leader-containing pheromone/bacteriocin [Lacticaseibacillus paracasei]|uniref:ComC/BlpC family leader-containing pheromone/bacteriocin n=1 Tax=Lacticaseibacillus paracasei TaxID=1597 RepID=UPI000C75B159|nr:ComC/BlpC family leader-containing pheromone/bacteriocin [Lacticaseibacillus paracasei]
MQQFMTLDNSSLEKIAGGENGGLWSIIGFGLGFSARSVLTGSLFVPSRGPVIDLIKQLTPKN